MKVSIAAAALVLPLALVGCQSASEQDVPSTQEVAGESQRVVLKITGMT
jgi:uncharacterized protein YcfL